MKIQSLLFAFFSLLMFSCGGDDACSENLPSLDQYISTRNLDVENGEQGLRYRILEPGSAERPSPTATVIVNYTGNLTNDMVFDATPEDGSRPARFPLNDLIRGWQLGVPLVGRGGRIQLFIPPSIGYGNRRAGEICPNSDLVFEIELINFIE